MTKQFSVNGNLDVGEKCLKIATFLDPMFKEKFLKDKVIISELIADYKTDQLSLARRESRKLRFA